MVLSLGNPKRKKFLEGFTDEELAEFLGLDEETQNKLIQTVPEEEVIEEPEPAPESLEPSPEVEEFDTSFLSPDVSIVPKIDVLTRLYGDKPEKERPELKDLASQVQTNPETFFKDLMSRGTQQDREELLKSLGADDALISQIFTEQQRLGDITRAAQVVFPELSLKELGEYAEGNIDDFIKDMRRGGFTKEKEILLREMGQSWEAIDEIFAQTEVVLPVQGVRKLVTLDNRTNRAYDDKGKFLGNYNPITRDIEKQPFSERVEDIVDAFSMASRGAWQNVKGFALTQLPNLIFRDITSVERKIQGGEWADMVNQRNKELRNAWRVQYSEEQVKYEEYVKGHPELQPRKDYEEGATKHPKLWTDPGWYAYAAASTAPLTLTAMGTGALATLASGGNFVVGAVAAGMVVFPVETQSLKEELLANGMSEDEANKIAPIAGGLITIAESAGRLPLIKSIAPTIMKMFRKEAGRELAKLTIRQMAKKGIVTFTESQFAETATEVLQEAIGNAAVKIANSDRSLFENLDVIAAKTFAGTLPFSFLGGASSMVRVSPVETKGLSDAERRAKGWERDASGDWWVKAISGGAEEEVTIPKAAEGMPEAGVQAEEVTLAGEKIPSPAVAPKVDEFAGISDEALNATRDKLRAANLRQLPGKQAQLTKVEAEIAKRESVAPKVTGVKEVSRAAKAGEITKDEYIARMLDENGFTQKGEEWFRRDANGKLQEVTGQAERLKEEFASTYDEIILPAIPKAAVPKPFMMDIVESVRGVPEKTKAFPTRVTPVGDYVVGKQPQQYSTREVTYGIYTKEGELVKGGFDKHAEAVEAARKGVAPKAIPEALPKADVGYLYHGTPKKNIQAIKQKGLQSKLRQRNDWEEGDRGPELEELLYFEKKPTRNWGGKQGVQLRVNEDLLPSGVDVQEDVLRRGEYYTSHRLNEAYDIPSEAIEYFDTKRAAWRPISEFGQPEALPEVEPTQTPVSKAEEVTAEAAPEEAAPPPTPPPQSVTLPPVEPTRNELKRIIKQSEEQVKQDLPKVTTRLLMKIPGIKQLMEFERPGLKMTGEKQKILVAMVAENATRSDVAVQAMSTRMDLFKSLRKAFGKDALHGGQVENVRIEDGRYVLTSEQEGVLAFLESRNDSLLELVVNEYGAEIGRFTPANPKPIDDVSNPITGTIKDIADHVGIFLPNVDISEDVIEYLGSETRAVATGRGKTRVWPTARDRMAGKTSFTPELDVVKLIEGLDNFKSNAAGGLTFRESIGGLTRLEVMKETHPELYEKMMSLRKRLTSLQGSAGTLESNIDIAINDFLNSPVEGADLLALRDNLDVKLKTGIRKGMDVDAIQNEITAVREELKALKPAWEAANLKPYVLVQENLFRYFPSDEAGLIKESRKTSNNPILNIIEKWRGQAFSGDFSPFSIQGFLGVLADPWGSLKAGVGGAKKSIETGDLLRSVRIDALAEDIGNNVSEWAQFASLMGRTLSGTPKEYAAGFLSKIPGFDKFTESTFITVTRGSFNLWQRTYKDMVKSGVDEVVAKVAAAKIASEVFPLVSPSRLGQSQARATALRALPTSYSFIRQPASLLADAATGLGKLATGQKLTPSESLSVKVALTGAASTLIVSATSAALSAMARGDDDDEVRKAIWDAINPDPRNGKFASIIIGKVRIPLGGPYRALFKAMFPQEVPGIPFPVPFAGIPMFLRNRLTPALKTQLDLLLNKDYSRQQIVKGKFPENVLRFLEYELEGFLPLTLGEVAEHFRHGDKVTDPLWQKVISQFMGVNAITLDNTFIDRQIRQLGLPIDTEAKPFTINKPIIYSTKNLWSDANRVLNLREKEEGYDDPPLLKAVIEARLIKKEADSLPNIKAISVNSDPSLGDTFVEYHEQWLERQKIKDEKKLEEFDKQYPKAELGNFSQSDYVLLRKYHSLTNKKERADFLKEHPSLSENPRNEWMKSHPDENAKLAIFGQAKVLTQAAYDKARALIKTLDIPEDALEGLLPPKEIAKDYFALLEASEKWGSLSWEAKLLVAKSDVLRKYAEREIVDTPIKSLELKVKHRFIFDKLDALSDKASPDYIADEKKRIEAIKKLKTPEFIDDSRRIEAIENKADDKTVESWVERGKIADLDLGFNAEDKLWLVDHPDVHQWALKSKLLTDDGKTWNVPVLKIDVQYRKQDKEYNALPEGLARTDYLKKNTPYRKDRRRREAYQITGWPQGEVENYVSYYELPTKGYRQERFLIENSSFGQAMHEIKGLDLPIKVPPVMYDDIYERYEEDFDKLWGLADVKSPHYIEDVTQRERAREQMRREGDQFTPLGRAEQMLNALKAGFPDYMADMYAYYMSLPPADRYAYRGENAEFDFTGNSLGLWQLWQPPKPKAVMPKGNRLSAMLLELEKLKLTPIRR